MPVPLLVLTVWLAAALAVVAGMSLLFTGRRVWQERAAAAAPPAPARRDVTRLPLAG